MSVQIQKEVKGKANGYARTENSRLTVANGKNQWLTTHPHFHRKRHNRRFLPYYTVGKNLEEEGNRISPGTTQKEGIIRRLLAHSPSGKHVQSRSLATSTVAPVSALAF